MAIRGEPVATSRCCKSFYNILCDIKPKTEMLDFPFFLKNNQGIIFLLWTTDIREYVYSVLETHSSCTQMEIIKRNYVKHPRFGPGFCSREHWKYLAFFSVVNLESSCHFESCGFCLSLGEIMGECSNSSCLCLS